MAKHILALDQGTTSSRAIVFDHDGRIVSVAQEEFPQILPVPGEVEHDPEAIWSTQSQVAKDALAKANFLLPELGRSMGLIATVLAVFLLLITVGRIDRRYEQAISAGRAKFDPLQKN